MSWTSDVVDELVELKRAGVDFPQAWRMAISAHPPRGRDAGMCATNLFDAAREPSIEEFFRAAAEDAWYGRRPALRHLRVLLEDGEVFPVPERVSNRPRRAAVRSVI